MARKRLNVRFLIILLTIVLVVGAAAAFFVRKALKGTPEQHIAEAERLEAAGELEEAAKAMGRAIKESRPPGPDLWVRFGDLMGRVAQVDNDAAGQMAFAYDSAIQTDPRHMPALERLLQYREEQVEMLPQRSQPGGLTALGETAARVLSADPQHQRARYVKASVPVRQRLAGAAVANEAVEQAEADLTALQAEDPSNADIPLLLARLGLFRGIELFRQNDLASADAAFAQVDEAITRLAAERQDSAANQGAAAQVMFSLASTSRQAEKRKEHLRRAGEYAARAVALVTPADPYFDEAMLLAARLQEQEGRPQEMEQTLRALLQEQPWNVNARLSLGELLGRIPGRRDEAIALLSEPLPPNQEYVGVKARQISLYELQAMLQRAEFRLDAIESRAVAADQVESALATVSDEVGKLLARTGETPAGLKARGRLELAKGQAVAGVQTLNRVLTMLDINDPTTARLRAETTMVLARAYMNTGQTGEARRLLTRLIEQIPGSIPPRLLLAETLVRENALAEARPHVDFLESVLPPSPQLTRLRLAVLDRERDLDKIEEYYGRLPEQTRDERLQKAQTAWALNKRDEAQRLFEAMVGADAGDAQAAQLLARVYAVTNQRDKALATLDAALAKNPDSNALRGLRLRLNDASPEELQAFVLEAISGVEDPLLRELALFEAARNRGDEATAIQHVEAAAKIAPDDGRVLDLQFNIALSKEAWDDAGRFLEKLAALNQDQANGLIYRVRLARARGQLQQALEQGIELTRQLPQFATSWVVLGQVQQAMGTHEAAAATYAQAIERQPGNLDAIRGLIESYVALNSPQDAKRFVDLGLRVAPNNSAMREMAYAYELNFGDPETVIAPRREQAEAQPDSGDLLLRLGLTQLAAAQKRQVEGRDDDAKRLFSDARATFEQGMARFPEVAVFAGYFADVALLQGDFEQADAALRGALAKADWPNRPESPQLLADFYVRAGRLPQAEQVLRDAMSRFPNSPDLTVRLAEVLVRSQRVDDAIAILRPSASDLNVLRRMIELMLATQQYDAARAALADARTAGIPETELRVMDAIIAVASDDLVNARRLLDAVLSENPRNALALYHRAVVELSSATPNLDQAVRDLTLVRELVPGNLDARMGLADAYRRRGDRDASIREYEGALQVDSGNKVAIARLIDLYASSTPPRWTQAERLLARAKEIPGLAEDPEVLHAEATMWASRGDQTRALQLLDRALAAAPQNVTILRSRLGLLLKAGQFQQVLAASEQAMKLSPEPWWAQQDRGVALRRLNNAAAAAEAFTRALDLACATDLSATSVTSRTLAAELGINEAMRLLEARQSQQPRAALVLAQMLQERDRIPEAITVSEAAMSGGFDRLTSAEQLVLLRLLGNLHLLDAPPNLERAAEAYRRVLERQPGDVTTLNNLANVYLVPGATLKPEEAVKYSQRAYDLMAAAGQREAFIMDTHGRALTLAGRVDEGLDVLRGALAIREFVDVRYHLGDALIMKNDLAEAEKELERAAQLIADMDAKQQRVDPALRSGVEAALSKIRAGR